MINVYKGPEEGRTIMKMTNGSTIGAVGDVADYVNMQLRDNRLLTVNNGDGTKLAVNPHHIVYALYTEPKEDNNG